jgi:hypothetical protein
MIAFTLNQQQMAPQYLPILAEEEDFKLIIE